MPLVHAPLFGLLDCSAGDVSVEWVEYVMYTMDGRTSEAVYSTPTILRTLYQYPMKLEIKDKTSRRA